MDEEVEALVVDNGSMWIRAGFAGDDAPRSVFPSAGPPLAPARTQGGGGGASRGASALPRPIEHGLVASWDGMERAWRAAFADELRVDPAERCVVLTETVLPPQAQRERTAQVMFETFSTPSLMLASTAVLALISSGRTTGVVVEVGEDVAHAVSIDQLGLVPGTVARSDVAGGALTAHVAALLRERGVALGPEAARDVKETLCFVAEDLDDAVAAGGLAQERTLPDGRVVALAEERAGCPEALFRPALVGSQADGIHEMCYASALRSMKAGEMLGGVVLAGGTTLFPGIAERLKREIARLAPPAKAKVDAPPERGCSVWIGGSILGSLSRFHNAVATKAEYDECGAASFGRKAPPMQLSASLVD